MYRDRTLLMNVYGRQRKFLCSYSHLKCQITFKNLQNWWNFDQIWQRIGVPPFSPKKKCVLNDSNFFFVFDELRILPPFPPPSLPIVTHFFLKTSLIVYACNLKSLTLTFHFLSRTNNIIVHWINVGTISFLTANICFHLSENGWCYICKGTMSLSVFWSSWTLPELASVQCPSPRPRLVNAYTKKQRKLSSSIYG